jgi:hypothetical protein
LSDEKLPEEHGLYPKRAGQLFMKVEADRFRIYDVEPAIGNELFPGKLPPYVDPSLEIPRDLPHITAPSSQHRYDRTPIYEGLT